MLQDIICAVLSRLAIILVGQNNKDPYAEV